MVMRVETYSEQGVPRQTAQQPLAERVDTGANLLPDAINSLVQTGAQAYKTQQKFNDDANKLFAREELVTFEEGKRNLLDQFSKLQGRDAVEAKAFYEDGLAKLRASSLIRAEGRLTGDTLKEFDLQMRSSLIPAYSDVSSKAEAGMRQFDSSTVKQLKDSALADGFSAGEYFYFAPPSAQAGWRQGFLAAMQNGETAHLGGLAKQGLLLDETVGAETEAFRSSYALMALQGAANSEGGLAAAEAMDAFLRDEGIEFKGADAVKAKSLLENLRKTAKENDYRQRVAEGTSALLGLGSISEMTEAAQEMDPEIRNEALRAATSQFNAVRADNEKQAAEALDTLYRHLQDPENLGLSAQEVAEKHPGLWDKIKDNRQMARQFMEREAIVTDSQYHGWLRTMSNGDLLARWQTGERDLNDRGYNSFLEEVKTKLSVTDYNSFLSRVKSVVDPAGSKSDTKAKIEEQWGRRLTAQLNDRWETMTGTKISNLGKKGRQSRDQFFNLVNAAANFEMEKNISEGGDGQMSNARFMEILDQYSEPFVVPGVFWGTNEVEFKNASPEFLDAILPAAQEGADYSDLQSLYDQNPDDVSEAISEIQAHRAQGYQIQWTSDNIRRVIQMIKSEQK